MPFITGGLIAVGVSAGVASFLGPVISSLIVAGLGIAARYLAGSMNRDRQPTDPAPQAPQVTPQASQLQTAYGEAQARTVLLGKVGTAGHLVYRNAFGPGNRNVQDVYVLSHFRIGGVARVRLGDRWHELVEDVLGGGVKPDGFAGIVNLRVYSGTMDQAADSGLVANANPAGRWSADHRGAGVAYVVVTSVLDKEHLRAPAQPFFEVEGAPLYDWRKDSTAGGDGAHRWADQSTWEFTENPALMMYALERGLFNGDELMVGKAVDASRLPLAEWSQAANICDEIVSGGLRYSAACIVSAGAGSTHDANMAPLLEACAGSWLQLPGEEYPLAGANQASAYTITDDDLIVDQPFRLSIKRPRTELVNTVAATIVSPANFYQPAPLATRIDADALAADRERLAVSIPYRAVTKTAVGDRLADIAIRASRYQANADIWVGPRLLGVKPGNWITWESARYDFAKVFQVNARRLGAFGNGARNVGLSLREVGDGVFDPTAYATTPPDGVGRGAPDFESELTDFVVTPYTVHDPDSGKQYPAIRCTWDAPQDPTVTGIELFWRPVFQPAAIQSLTVQSDQTTAILVNGVVSSKVFEVAYRLVTHPYRETPLSDWVEVLTPNAAVTDIQVTLANIAAEVQAIIRDLVRSRAEFRALIERVSMDAAIGTGKATETLAAVSKTGRSLAAAVLDLTALATETEALATAVLGVQADFDGISASARIRFVAQVPPPAGVLAQIELMAAVEGGGDFKETGMVIQLYDDGGTVKSRLVVLADQFIVSDGTNTHLPMVFESGTLTLNAARLAVADIGYVEAGEVVL